MMKCIKNSMIRKLFSILILAVMFTHTACAKDQEERTGEEQEELTGEEQEEGAGIITMTTTASELNFRIRIKEGTEKSVNLAIDWGDGEKSRITKTTSIEEPDRKSVV